MRRLNLDETSYCRQPGCGDEPDTINPRLALELLRGLCRLHQRHRLDAVHQREQDLDRADELGEAAGVGPLQRHEIEAFLQHIPNERDTCNPHAVVWMNYQRLATQLRMAADAIRGTLASADTTGHDDRQPAGEEAA